MNKILREPDGRMSQCTLTSSRELLPETLRRLEAAYDFNPAELERRVDHAVRALVCLRDQLIAEDRVVAPERRAGQSKALREVNTALSLLVGVDYPAAGIKRELMKTAEQLLRNLAATD